MVLVIWHVILVIFLEIQWYLSKLKSNFGMLNLGQEILGKTAVLVILIIIYVNLCDWLLSPSAGAIMCICI